MNNLVFKLNGEKRTKNGSDSGKGGNLKTSFSAIRWPRYRNFVRQKALAIAGYPGTTMNG
jgi:hypothetical protein